jgi:hypothetical protein
MAGGWRLVFTPAAPEAGVGGQWRACCNQHESSTVRVQEKISSAVSP